MDDDTAGRRSLLGIAGLASLCCISPGAAAVTGGAAASGLGSGLVQTGVTALTLAIVALVVRRRSGCSDCDYSHD